MLLTVGSLGWRDVPNSGIFASKTWDVESLRSRGALHLLPSDGNYYFLGIYAAGFKSCSRNLADVHPGGDGINEDSTL